MATVKVFGGKTSTPVQKKNYKNDDALEKSFATYSGKIRKMRRI